MSNPVQINVRMPADKSGIVLSISQDGEDLAFAELSPPDVEEVLELLGKARAELIDHVPTTIDRGTRMKLIVEPGWSTPANPSPDGKAFAIRHPGYGWFGFLFNWTEAKRLAAYLTSDHPAE